MLLKVTTKNVIIEKFSIELQQVRLHIKAYVFDNLRHK